MLGRVFDKIEQGLALTALCALVIAVLSAGIGRTINHPVLAAAQYAQLALIWACVLSADIAVREGRHIRINLLFDILPRRVRAVLAALSFILIVPFLIFTAWYGWFLAIDNWQRELGASGLSYGLVTLALPVGAVLLLLSFVRRLLSSGLVKLFDDLPEAAPEDGGGHPKKEDVL